MTLTGLRNVSNKAAAPPYTLGPYTWDQELTLTNTLTLTHTRTMTVAAVAQNYRSIIIDNAIVGGIVGAVSKLNVIEQTITHATTDMPNLRLKCADWTIVASKNVKDIYAIQLEVDIDSAAVISGQCGVLSTSLQLNSSGTHTGEAQALYVSVGGAGAGTMTELTVAKIGQSCTGVKTKGIIELGASNGSTTHAALLVDGEGTADTFIKFDTVGVFAGSCIRNTAVGSTTDRWIKIEIGSVEYNIACLKA